MAIARVSIDLSVLTRDNGIIDQEIERRSIRVESQGRILCPVGRTGHLRRSIEHDRGSRPLVWKVVSGEPYSMWIHEGLRYDPRAGRTVFVRRGPRPYLVEALEAAR